MTAQAKHRSDERKTWRPEEWKQAICHIVQSTLFVFHINFGGWGVKGHLQLQLFAKGAVRNNAS